MSGNFPYLIETATLQTKIGSLDLVSINYTALVTGLWAVKLACQMNPRDQSAIIWHGRPSPRLQLLWLEALRNPALARVYTGNIQLNRSGLPSCFKMVPTARLRAYSLIKC